MADITLTGTIYDNSGKPAPGRRVSFLCDFQMIGDQFIDAITKEVVSDNAGKFTVAFPQSANLQVLLPGGERLAVTLPARASVDLDELTQIRPAA